MKLKNYLEPASSSYGFSISIETTKYALFSSSSLIEPFCFIKNPHTPEWILWSFGDALNIKSRTESKFGKIPHYIYHIEFNR